MSSLADRQAALVEALVAGGPPPPGFDRDRLAAAGAALRRKRADEAAHAWPELAAALGPQWRVRFDAWARDRRPGGALRDGWDLARSIAAELPVPARVELALRECRWRYDGTRPPTDRLLPRFRLVDGVIVGCLLGRSGTWNLRRATGV